MADSELLSFTAEPVQFAEGNRGMFTPIGDTGLSRWGGFVQDPDPFTLQGPRWYTVVRRMLTNPIIKGQMFAVEMLIRRAEWATEPAADGGTEAQEIADFVEGARHDMRVPWEDTLAQILSFLPYGFSLMEIVLKRRLGIEQDPYSGYEDGLIGWDEWSPRAQETVFKWHFDDYGRVVAFDQQSPSMPGMVTIPTSRCLHFKAGGYRGSPEGESVLRAAYADWDAINKLQLIESIGIERGLAGLPIAFLPPIYMSGEASEEQKATYRSIKRIVTGVRQNDQAGVVFPMQYDQHGNKLYDFQLMSTGGERAFDTSAVITRRERQMTLAMLADFMMLGAEATGSYALSKDKTQLWTTAIGAWLDLIANVINDQAIRPLIRINGIDPRLTPKIVPGSLDETELGQLGQFFSAIQPLWTMVNDDDKLAIGEHLMDLVDFPSLTTTADEIQKKREEAQAQAMQGMVPQPNIPGNEPPKPAKIDPKAEKDAGKQEEAAKKQESANKQTAKPAA